MRTATSKPSPARSTTLSVSCSSASFDEGGTARVVYSLTSRASLGGAAGSLAFVERSVSAAVEF